MRLGAYPAKIKKEQWLFQFIKMHLFQKDIGIGSRLMLRYQEALEENGLTFSDFLKMDRSQR